MTALKSLLGGSAAPPNAGGLEIVESRTTHVIGTWRNCVLVVWRGETTAQALDRVRLVLNRVNQQRRTKVGLVQYVPEDAPLPFDKSIRDAIVRMLADARQCVACSCVIAPGTGFRQAAGRAIVTGIAMLARPGFPHVVLPTLEEAAAWQLRLLPQMNTGKPTAVELVHHLNRLLSTKPEPLGSAPQVNSARAATP